MDVSQTAAGVQLGDTSIHRPIRSLRIVFGRKRKHEEVKFAAEEECRGGEVVHKKVRILCGGKLIGSNIIRDNNDDVTTKLLRQRKLCLVLDLDHTLLHSTRLKTLTSDEAFYLESRDSSSEFPGMVTKLRPFVGEFLKEASKMFDMYINTMGNRSYAAHMANLLDPDKEFFFNKNSSSKVISREDNVQRDQKSLRLVPNKERAVIILDDTESVWTEHRENLIVLEKYEFFASAKRRRQLGAGYKSHSEQRTDERESEGELARVLKLLRHVHSKFFDDQAAAEKTRDVRELLKMTGAQEIVLGL